MPIVNQFFANFAYMGTGFVLTPLLLEEIYGYGPSRIGFLITSRPLFFGVAGPIVSWIGIRLGEKLTAVSGSVMIVVSSLLLAMVTGVASDAFVFLALGVAGLGLGLSMPSMTTVLINAVDDADIAVATGTQQMVWQMGTVAGIQLLQSFQAARAASVGAEAAYQQAFLVGAAVAVLGAIAALFVRSSARAETVGAARAPTGRPGTGESR
jgi:MFS family permease